jgi:hypothetical protein
MSFISRISHWLAFRLRPAEAAPDLRDLNLRSSYSSRAGAPLARDGGGLVRDGGGLGSALPPDADLQRRLRLARWRAGPWQQK